jgi:hypothetical protein
LVVLFHQQEDRIGKESQEIDNEPYSLLNLGITNLGWMNKEAHCRTGPDNLAFVLHIIEKSYIRGLYQTSFDSKNQNCEISIRSDFF